MAKAKKAKAKKTKAKKERIEDKDKDEDEAEDEAPKVKKVARRIFRKPAAVVVPGPWNPSEHKAEYLEMLNSAKNKARLKLSGQLLSVMHGRTEEKDGDPIPSPVQNLGRQLSGLVEQVATKDAIADFDQAKVIYERERQRKVEEAAAE